MNPYNMNKEEGKYHTWTSGFEARSEEENPYSDQTDEVLYKVWKQGYKAAKKLRKVDDPLEIKTSPIVISGDLRGFSKVIASPLHSIEVLSTEELEKELFKRKSLELQDLKEALSIITKKINKIENLIND